MDAIYLTELYVNVETVEYIIFRTNGILNVIVQNFIDLVSGSRVHQHLH